MYLGRVALFGFVTIWLLGESAFTQELDGDLIFDDATIFQEISSQNGPNGPDVSATLSFAISKLSSATTDSAGLNFVLSDRYDLGKIGFLDWSGHIKVNRSNAVSTAEPAINKIIFQNSAGNVSWKVGKFAIGWGEIEGIPVLDVLNSGLSLGTAGTGIDELPGQWFASAEMFAGETTLSGFIGPKPDVSHIKMSRMGGNTTEYGLRATLPTSHGQYSVYTAQLVPQSGVVDRVTLISVARPYKMIGLSAHRAVGAALLEVDLAYKTELLRASALDLTTHDRFDLALGVEYAISDVTQLNSSITVEHWLDQDTNYFDTGLGGSVMASQSNASYLISLTSSIFDGKLGLNGYYGRTMDASSQFFTLGVEYPISDNLNIETTYRRISASSSSTLAPIDGTQSLSISAEYFF